MREKTMYDTPLAREALQHLNAISDAQQKKREQKGKGDSGSEGSLKGR